MRALVAKQLLRPIPPHTQVAERFGTHSRDIATLVGEAMFE